MCKLEIEQGYSKVEFEFKSLYEATEVISSIKYNTTKPIKFIITDNVEEKGEQDET